MEKLGIYGTYLLGLPQEGPKYKMLAFSSPEGGSWSQAFLAWTAETGDESRNFGNQ